MDLCVRARFSHWHLTVPCLAPPGRRGVCRPNGSCNPVVLTGTVTFTTHPSGPDLEGYHCDLCFYNNHFLNSTHDAPGSRQSSAVLHSLRPFRERLEDGRALLLAAGSLGDLVESSDLSQLARAVGPADTTGRQVSPQAHFIPIAFPRAVEQRIRTQGRQVLFLVASTCT